MAAKNSKIFDKIHISTECKKIRQKLKNRGINIDFLREKKLADKNTGVFEVYKFVYNEYKKKGLIFDEIWAILPCSPLLESRDLIKLKKLVDSKKIKKPIISVSKYNAPIEWALKIDKNKKLSFLYPKKQNLPSQNFLNSYYDTGSICVFDNTHFHTKKKFFGGKFYGFITPAHKSIDIDNIEDWNFAQKLFKLKRLRK